MSYIRNLKEAIEKKTATELGKNAGHLIIISQKTVISELCIDAIYAAQGFKENESATIQKMTCLVNENQTIDRVLCNLAA